MKIAITGGTGFLGRYVVDCIKENNNTPVVLTRKSNEISNTDIEYRNTDYSEGSLENILEDIDAVVHLASNRGAMGRISEFHNNEIITQNLYEACVNKSITNLVYASTISVYSDKDLLPWKEDQVTAPMLMYGVSKAACENIGGIYSNKKGLFIKNLRFAHLFGFNEKNNYMINKFMRQAFHKEQLIIDAKSIAKREFLYAKDAAKAVCSALNKEKASGSFNIGSGEALTNYEAAEEINRVFNNEGNLIIKDPCKYETIEPSYMDNSKSSWELDFLPDYCFKKALEEIYIQMKELKDVPLLY